MKLSIRSSLSHYQSLLLAVSLLLSSSSGNCNAHVAAMAEEEQRRHPLEDVKSWELHQQRQQRQTQQQKEDVVTAAAMSLQNRRLSYETVQEANGDDAPYTIKHKKLKDHIPFAGGDTDHGFMIDA
jgi:hypothetical protein